MMITMMTKKIPPRHKYPLVEIRWHDATTHNMWVDIADLKKEVGIDATVTVGFLVKEDEDAYYIASTYH